MGKNRILRSGIRLSSHGSLMCCSVVVRTIGVSAKKAKNRNKFSTDNA